MSYDNPTPLQVGARGTLHGWTMTVVGRVVLGVELDGERYYWNEFNLVDAEGHAGTLVYEEGEDGPEWKLFRMLTPRTPLTVAEAETKRVGDRVSFGGEAIPVTLVDRSRVYHIEGQAPEGVEVGDLADFINADAGDHMIVVSWTGSEIEFYEGRDVPAATVATAFGLPHGAPAFTGGSAGTSSFGQQPPVIGSSWFTSGRLITLVVSLLSLVGILSSGSCIFRLNSPSVAPEPVPVKQPAPPLRLVNGTSGLLGTNPCTVSGQALVEVGRIAGRYDRREYHLQTEVPIPALLVNGLTGGTRQWHLLRPVPPPRSLTPYQAAAQRKGSTVNFGAATATVTELFLSQALSVEGDATTSSLPAGRQYGFLANNGADWWLARWNEQALTLYRGTALDEKIVLSSLGPGPEKPR